MENAALVHTFDLMIEEQHLSALVESHLLCQQ